MLNIGRMGRGSQRYYLDAVARRPADYYLGHGEAPGRWAGSGLGGLSLTAGEQVEPATLERVLDGDHPATGERVAAHPARQVPGFDLTFRAPKSVSLLWALSDDPTATAVEQAHEAAVTATLGYLEQYAAQSRRGAGGVEQVAVDGLVTAAFTHRTSRAGDPLLHTHLLVANLARTTDDGVWRTVDSRRLFTHAKTAGTLYQAHLRAELTRTLGVAWRPVVHGCADLAGVDRDWIEAFSKRRAAIVAHMAARGETSATATQVATLDTRQPKQVQPDQPDLRARWRTEARRHGIPEGWWRDVVDRRERPRPERTWLSVAPEELTEHTATFAFRDVARILAEHAPDGATVTDVLESATLAGRLSLRHGQWIPVDPDRQHGLVDVVRRSDGTPVNAAGEDRRFTTRRLLTVEQTATTTSVARCGDHVAVVPEPLLQRAVDRRPTLGADQQRMVRRLCRDGDGVAVVVGKAGTGKTYALDAARDAWQTAGVRVTGVALAARAALELRDSAGVESTTLARLLAEAEDPRAQGSPLRPGQVLVVDEAGMIGTQQLARLLHHTHARQVKVVLVGDPRQLPEIDAGGLFTGLTRQLPTIELTDNRRQVEPWEQLALDQLRHGNPATAVTDYADHGRLVTADTADEIRQRLVDGWWDSFDPHRSDRSIMVALRRADVDDLNRRARARMGTAGLLTGPTLQLDQLEVRAGDRIVCLRNDHRAGLVNGLRGAVTAVHDDATLTIVDDADVTRTIPTEYLEAGHVTHGYAITGHKAQGLTVDHAHVLGSDALYREWGYVAMSRGRQSNRLYVHGTDELEPDAHQPPRRVNPTQATVTRLYRSRANQPLAPTLGQRLRDLEQFLASPESRQASALHDRRRHLRSHRSHLEQHRDRLASQLDQHRRPITRRARAERNQTREGLARATDRLADLDGHLRRVEQELSGLPTRDELAHAERLRRTLTGQLHRTADQLTLQALHRPPDYLTRSLGPLPHDVHGRDAWRRAAQRIHLYRTRWDITHPTSALGDQPIAPEQRHEYQQAVASIERHRRELQREQTRGRTQGRGIRLSR